MVNTDRVCVWLGAIEAYATGAMLEVAILGREPALTGVESGQGTWRFGVEFADGRKAVTYGLGGFAQMGSATSARAFAQSARRPYERPDAPQLSPRGGGGSRSRWRQEYWLWPLPPEGELVIACEWPNLDLELSTATLDAALIREAGARSRTIWPDEELPDFST